VGTDRRSLGDLIRVKRLERGLTARGLSVAAGLSSSYVTKVEAGLIAPSLETFARLASALRMNPSEVFYAVHSTRESE
jgi:transcriptional regulator with XRE-family HTH domain